MTNNKGQFVKGHKIFKNNPFTVGNKIGPRFKKGYTPWNKNKKTGPQDEVWREKISKALSGRKMTDDQREALMKPKLGGATQYWFGTKEEYKSLHHKIGKKFGKPTKCDRCGKDGLVGRQIHWANKSKKYKMVRSDWMRLCVKCHAYLDKSTELNR